MPMLQRFAAGRKVFRRDVPKTPRPALPRRGFLATTLAGLGLVARPAVAAADEWIVTPEPDEPGPLMRAWGAARAAYDDFEARADDGVDPRLWDELSEVASRAQKDFILAVAAAAGVNLDEVRPNRAMDGCFGLVGEVNAVACVREGSATFLLVHDDPYTVSSYDACDLGFAGTWRVRPIVAEGRSAAHGPAMIPPRLAHECQFHGSPMRLEVLPPGRDPAPLVGAEKLLTVRELAAGTGWRLAIVLMPFSQADEDESRKWASDRGHDPDRFCPRGSMAGQLP